MGRESEDGSRARFARLRAFAIRYGKDWKSKTTVQNSSKIIEHITRHALKDNIGNIQDPVWQEKIDRINKFALDISTMRADAFNVHCKDCGARLYQEATVLITLAQYEGLPCPTKKECKTQRKHL